MHPMKIDEARDTDAKPSVTFLRGGPSSLAWPLVFGICFLGTVFVGIVVAPSVEILAGSSIWLVAAWLTLSAVRVEVHEGRGVLDVLRLHWPLPPRRRSFPLDAVRDVRVKKRAKSRGAAWYSVELVVDGADRVALSLETRDEEGQRHLATRLQAVLGRGEDTKGSWE
jgi:hypothetical protein